MCGLICGLMNHYFLFIAEARKGSPRAHSRARTRMPGEQTHEED